MIQKTVTEWQAGRPGKDDPFSYHRSGKWYGYGITSQFERPLTVRKLMSMIAYGTSHQRGIAPNWWVLSREMAAEMCADSGCVLLGQVPGSHIMGQIEDGTLKVCGVPIVLEKEPLALAQQMAKNVPRWYDNPFMKLLTKNADEAKKTTHAATREDIVRGYELVCGIDHAAGRDEAVVSGLHPLPEYVHIDTHWVQEIETGKKYVWEWCVSKWFAPGVATLLAPGCVDVRGYRYLGPCHYQAQAVGPAMLRDKDIEILRLKQENERLRSVAEVALKAANPLYKVAIPNATEAYASIPVIRMASTGFGTPDLAAPPTEVVPTPKPPIPLRALSNDRQPIGLRGWK